MTRVRNYVDGHKGLSWSAGAQDFNGTLTLMT